MGRADPALPAPDTQTDVPTDTRSAALLDRLAAPDPQQQRHALVQLLALLRTAAGPASGLYCRVLRTALFNRSIDPALLFFAAKEYLGRYVDLQYYFYAGAHRLAREALRCGARQRALVEAFTANLVVLLVNTRPAALGTGECWAPGAQRLRASAQRRVFSRCWMAALQLPLKHRQYMEVLRIVHSNVLPFLQRPRLLMDFLADSYGAGGAVSLLALNGLFYLMQNHNLDYPDFYAKLYALFDESLLHSRYRGRFVKLVDLFLSSTHLPAMVVASFIKRVSRLCLTATPGGIIMVIPLVYNLLKRHSTCMVLIHRASASPIADDPFLDKELDPSKTRALDSSLWELYTLVDHYYPSVSTLARIFLEQFTKPSYNLDDFLDYSYANLIDTEMNCKVKDPPSIEYQSASGTFAAKEGSNCIFTSLWNLSDISV